MRNLAYSCLALIIASQGHVDLMLILINPVTRLYKAATSYAVGMCKQSRSKARNEGPFHCSRK